MLGVTSGTEDRAKTFAWVETLGVEYPWAFAADRSLHEACGVKGIPHAALVDPEGHILWTGSPYRLDQKALKEALRGASKTLTFGWGEAFEDAAEHVIEDEFAKALAVVDRLEVRETPGCEAVRQSIVRKLGRRMAKMNELHAAGDILASLTIAEALDGELDGLEQADEVQAKIREIESDPDSKRILKGQETLVRIKRGNLKKSKQVQAAIRKAQSLAEKYEGTIVEKQALEFVKVLQLRHK